MPVVDASVALKWFVDEPDSPAAIMLRDAHVSRNTPLIAPDLLIYEIANALLHNSRFSENDVLRSVQTVYDLQMDLLSATDDLAERAIRLAGHHKLTFYDALYVALAQEIGTELITADRHLHRRLGEPSLLPLSPLSGRRFPVSIVRFRPAALSPR